MEAITLESVIQNQSAQIANLTEMLGQFLMQKSTRNVLKLDSQEKRQLKIENSIRSIAEFKPTEKEIELMRKIEKLPNVRKREDGRYEWRKMIAGNNLHVIERDPVLFYDKYKALQKRIKRGEIIKPEPVAKNHTLSKLCEEFYIRNIKGKIETDTVYEMLFNRYLCKLTKHISQYTKNDIIDVIASMTGSKERGHSLLKRVFAEATEEGILKRNPILTLKKPKAPPSKGRWFTPDEQLAILKNIKKSKMEYEILFYFLTGCRASEALKAVPHFEKGMVYVTRKKADGTSGWVKISERFCKILKENWHNMFTNKSKHPITYYGNKFSNFLKKIGIKQAGLNLHSLRHSFCSNLFYLGVPLKMVQYLMGHKSISMTGDVYTSLDPFITKQDILNVWEDFYPEFDPKSDPKNEQNTELLPDANHKICA